jgi:hypothetical protein
MNSVLLDYLAAFFAFLSGIGIVRVIIAAAILVGLWLGLQRTGLDNRTRVATWLAIAVPLFVWLVVVWQLAFAGVLQGGQGRVPSLPVAIIVPVLVGLVLLVRSRRIAAVLDVIPPTWLVGLQVYRVFGATFLVQWGLGHLSGVFALPAGIGDILVGMLALPVAFYLGSGARGGRTIAIAWNLLGILDLIVAVTLGALSQSGLLQGLGVPNTPIGYPLVMIPAFAVPQSLILHGLSLWQLRRAARHASSRADLDQASIRQGARAAARHST